MSMESCILDFAGAEARKAGSSNDQNGAQFFQLASSLTYIRSADEGNFRIVA